MSDHRAKPKGKSGPIKVDGGDAIWEVIEFPDGKAERENWLAHLFVEAFDRYVASQSEPSYAPFGLPQQNDENDLDFTVATATGVKLMELAEFAPLREHGLRFENAPPFVEPSEKAALAHELIRMKSAHQGGPDRFLVLYATEHAFWLDPLSIERLRRALDRDRPRFDRVYWVSVHDLTSASVSEIYPGTPHHIVGNESDEQLDQMIVTIPHPREMLANRTPDGGIMVPLRRPKPRGTVVVTYEGFDDRRPKNHPGHG